MKFLIIRFSSIGDIVLTTPVIRCLKEQTSTTELHYLTKNAYRGIIADNPYIDKAHFVENNLGELIKRLRRENFDYVIDLHHNLRSLRVKRALAKPSFSFDKLNIEKWLYTALKINRLPGLHIVDRYLDTVKPFGIRNDGRGLDFFIRDEERIKATDIPTSHQAGYIAMVIGAAVNTKKYPVHKFRELCGLLDHPVILLGGAGDAENGREIASVDNIKVYNACGKFSLAESADLVSRAKLVITNDTGLMHIAAAFKRPVISLWGNTVPAFGMYPYYGDKYLGGLENSPHEMVEIKDLACRPCSKIGYKKCPRGHFKCMESIRTDDLLKRIERRIRFKDR